MTKLMSLCALLLLSSCHLLRAEGRACGRLVELCGEGGDNRARREQCEGALTQLRTSAGAEAVDKSTTCIGEAKSCAAAAGCLVGGIGSGMVNEFLKGLGSLADK